MPIRTLSLDFTEEDFRKLQREKNEYKAIGQCSNWEEFILLRCLENN